jgi:hypothetical protein
MCYGFSSYYGGVPMVPINLEVGAQTVNLLNQVFPWLAVLAAARFDRALTGQSASDAPPVHR